MADSFPRQQARTRRFTLGAPRSFSVSADGDRVVFLRSAGGEDPLTALWVMDLPSGEERLVVDPRQLRGSTPFPPGEETAEERARRERARETASGIVSYAVDEAASRASFSVAGGLWVADLDAGGCRELEVAGSVFDPRLSPAGDAIAYCSGGSLRVMTLHGADGGPSDTVVAGGDGEADVTWGQAEFVASEEMGRSRGFWWSPAGDSLLVARVDNAAVATWWIADPAHPQRPPVAHRYPAAGTHDAAVDLHRVGLDGGSSPVCWDRAAFPYLVAVTWTSSGPPLLLVESRDHHRSRVLRVDGGTTEAVAGSDDEAWVDRIPGLPAWLDDGRLVWGESSAGTHRVVVAGEPVTPPGLQVRSVLGVAGGIVFSASEDPVRTGLWSWSEAGLEQLAGGGVVSGAAGGGSVVVAAHRMDGPSRYFACHRRGGQRAIASLAAEPVTTPVVKMLEAGERRLRVGVVLPRDHVAGAPLPVVMSPYGGPGAQRVVEARSAWLESQWLADQGFAVVVADGRGTPGRGPEWERAVAGDLASAVLEDQVTALEAAADAVAELDVGRGVGIRGWSFGGYLAALAVLRRPDVFAVAVAGAPVTDWRLYDTYYTERFLGHPDTEVEAYRRSSLLDDAARLRRPLMLIHGLMDDNVVVAHSLRLSQALTEAGRPHTVLPLSGITHMAAREEVAEHLLELQVDFLATHLGVGVGPIGGG